MLALNCWLNRRAAKLPRYIFIVGVRIIVIFSIYIRIVDLDLLRRLVHGHSIMNAVFTLTWKLIIPHVLNMWLLILLIRRGLTAYYSISWVIKVQYLLILTFCRLFRSWYPLVLLDGILGVFDNSIIPIFGHVILLSLESRAELLRLANWGRDRVLRLVIILSELIVLL